MSKTSVQNEKILWAVDWGELIISPWVYLTCSILEQVNKIHMSAHLTPLTKPRIIKNRAV